jgi:hypothetical protein
VARLVIPGMDGASAPSSLATSSGQAVSWCQACSRPVALCLVVGVVGALGHAWVRSIQNRRADVAECGHNRDSPYGTGDLPAVAYARPVRGESLHVPTLLLNIDGTVDSKGDREDQQ